MAARRRKGVRSLINRWSIKDKRGQYTAGAAALVKLNTIVRSSRLLVVRRGGPAMMAQAPCL
jgi:hypothetical protein